jgi:hypothetical protein
MDINLIDSAETALDLFEDVNAIIAAVPCTEFTKSGNQYWKIKDEDGRTRDALELVYQVQRLVDLFRPTDPDYDEVFFWAIENPAGRLPKLVPSLGKGLFFHPYEFAGWLDDVTKSDLQELERIRAKNGIDVSEDEAALIEWTNAYKKQTGLWGEFNRAMIKKSIEPVRACAQGGPTQRRGGKSDRTKELRSFTPEGFARAFYEANKDFKAHLINTP